MGFNRFIIGMTLATLFAIAIIGFGIGFANDNVVYTDISDDAQVGVMNASTFTNMSVFVDENEENISGGWSQMQIKAGDENTESGGIFKSMSRGLKTIPVLLDYGLVRIFGGRSSQFAVVFSTLTALILVVFILWGWKTWKGGNPD